MRRRRRSVIGVFLERRSAGGANRARDGSSCFLGSRIEKKKGTHTSKFPQHVKKEFEKRARNYDGDRLEGNHCVVLLGFPLAFVGDECIIPTHKGPSRKEEEG